MPFPILSGTLDKTEIYRVSATSACKGKASFSTEITSFAQCLLSSLNRSAGHTGLRGHAQTEQRVPERLSPRALVTMCWAAVGTELSFIPVGLWEMGFVLRRLPHSGRTYGQRSVGAPCALYVALRPPTSSSSAKWTGVWSVCSWKYLGSDTVQSTHFSTPIATTGNLQANEAGRFLYTKCVKKQTTQLSGA